MSDLMDNLVYATHSSLLNLIIFPTEQCNFRCTYCYEDFAIGKMKKGVVMGIKNLLSTRVPDLSFLDISWFGGEPLLALGVIREISSHIVALTTQHPKLIYRSDMTTNAYLLDRDTFEELLQLGVTSYQISLDGDETIHNKTRLRADGKGTFEQIWENLRAMKSVESNFQITLRVHFSPDNWRDLDKLIIKINSEFGTDKRFRVYFKDIELLGGPNDHITKVFDEASKDLVRHTLNRKLSAPSMSQGIDSNYICYASKTNSFGVRANGDLIKCTVALNDARNKIGKINSDGSLSIEKDKLLLWLGGLSSLNKKELACPYGQMPKFASDFSKETTTRIRLNVLS